MSETPSAKAGRLAPEAVQPERPSRSVNSQQPAGAEQPRHLAHAADGASRPAPGSEPPPLRPEAGAQLEPDEMPSFRRLSDGAFFHRATAHGLETETEPSSPHQPVAVGRQAAVATAFDRGDAGALPRSQPRLFLSACLFVAGVATGVGVAHVLEDLPIPATIGSVPGPVASGLERPERRTGAGLPRDASAGGAAAARMRANPDLARDDPDAARPPPEVGALSAMMDRLGRQIAARHLDQPESDNALDTYRQIAAQWPDDAARAGQPLRAAFWLQAENARAAAHWAEALHYLNILKTLPPALPASGAGRDGAGAAGSAAAVE